jgi:hypothetical protein
MTKGNLSLICKNVRSPGSVAFYFVHGPGLEGEFVAVSYAEAQPLSRRQPVATSLCLLLSAVWESDRWLAASTKQSVGLSELRGCTAYRCRGTSCIKGCPRTGGHAEIGRIKTEAGKGRPLTRACKYGTFGYLLDHWKEVA